MKLNLSQRHVKTKGLSFIYRSYKKEGRDWMEVNSGNISHLYWPLVHITWNPFLLPQNLAWKKIQQVFCVILKQIYHK